MAEASKQRAALKELVRTATEVHRISDRTHEAWIALAAALDEARAVMTQPDETDLRQVPRKGWMIEKVGSHPPQWWKGTECNLLLDEAWTTDPNNTAVFASDTSALVVQMALARNTWRYPERTKAIGKLTVSEHEWPTEETPDGYKDAYYKIADLLGMSAMPISPKEAFETVMLPRLRELLAEKAAAESKGDSDGS